MERMLARQGGYEVMLQWLPGREDEAVICLTGPGMQTAHLRYRDQWQDLGRALQRAWVKELDLECEGRLFTDEEAE